MHRIVNIPPIEYDGMTHHRFHALEIRIAESLPFRDEQKRVSALDASVIVRRELDASARKSASLRPSLPGRKRSLVAPSASRLSMILIAGASRMSFVRGLNERPHIASRLSRRLPSKCLRIFSTKRDRLILVDGVDCLEDLHIVFMLLSRIDQRFDVFGKTAAAESDTRETERPDRCANRPRGPCGSCRRWRRPVHKDWQSRS